MEKPDMGNIEGLWPVFPNELAGSLSLIIGFVRSMKNNYFSILIIKVGNC
jgi:hypothetical protein